MSVASVGQPGTFLVNRPTLSFILILCAIALLGLSGEARAGHVLGVVWSTVAMPALGAMAVLCLSMLLSAIAPGRTLTRNGLSVLCLGAGLGAARLWPGLADAALVGGVLAAIIVWLGQYLGRAAALSIAAGQLVVLVIGAGAAAWLVRSGALVEGGGAGLVAPFGLALAVMVCVLATDNFVARIASNDGARLAAANTVNLLLRHMMILMLAALLFGWLGLVPLPAETALLPLLVLPVTVLLFGAGTVAAGGVSLSLNSLYEPVTRSADRGWLKTGLTVSRLSGFARPVTAAAGLGILTVAIATSLALTPAGGALPVLRDLFAWAGLFGVILLVIVSFRAALIVTLSVLAADLVVQPALAVLAPPGALADWRWLTSLMVCLAILRQAGIWRGEVARMRRGRELMVRSMAAGLPGILLALSLASLGLTVLYCLAGAAGQAPWLAAQIMLKGIVGLTTANLMAILLRGLIRESERQAASPAL